MLKDLFQDALLDENLAFDVEANGNHELILGHWKESEDAVHWPPSSNLANLVICGLFIKNQYFVT